MAKQTAIEFLKDHAFQLSRRDLESSLRLAMDSKGYDHRLLHRLSYDGQLGRMLVQPVLRIEPSFDEVETVNNAGRSAFSQEQPQRRDLEEYKGSTAQNVTIDSCIAKSSFNKSDRREERQRKFSGRGAMPIFELLGDEVKDVSPSIKNTPVTILGGGPAGLMTARGLVEAGWNPQAITVIEKTGVYGGIWNMHNVAGLSRNNPRDFHYLGEVLKKAPGGGEEVTEFLFNLQHLYTSQLKAPIAGTVLEVKPGDLKHTVYYKGKGKPEVQSIESPIVINALGTGKPLPISKPGKIITNATPSQAGYRWQQIITPEMAKSWKKKRVTFVGLGNSTGEMLVQLDQWRRKGITIDYRVLTHYPLEAVIFPEDIILGNDGDEYRVFRDVKSPNLVDYAGDLDLLRDAYFRALKGKKIISDVSHWDLQGERNGGTLHIKKSDGQSLELRTDVMFTLIGYSHPLEVFEKMGLSINPETSTPAFDYDGEFQRKLGAKGRKRVYPGYFGLGCVLQSKENPNAIVIPGMMHRMGDLMFSVAMRAYEYQAKKQ